MSTLASPIGRLGRALRLPLALGLACVTLLTAVTLGIRIPWLGLVAPFPLPAGLDYSFSGDEFTTLREQFIRNAFGETIPRAVAGGVGADRDGPSRTAPPGRDPPGVDETHPPTNDDFEEARPISTIPYTARSNTETASPEAAEPTDCGRLGGTVWYRYTPPNDIGLIANTFGTTYATVLGVFSGSRVDELESLACDTDPGGNAQVGFPVVAGTTYYFQITGPLGGGDLVFNLMSQGTTIRASVSEAGEQSNLGSHAEAISANGRYVAFASHATNLVPDFKMVPCVSQESLWQDGGCPNVFVRDNITRRVSLISVSSTGEQGNAASGRRVSISADGRFVAFESHASNLVPGDTNGVTDVFLHDRVTGATTRVSVSSTGQQGSDDVGDFPGFGYGPARFDWNVSGSSAPSISSDGRFIAFASYSSNLVRGDSNRAHDVFVHDRVAGNTTRVSVSSNGEPSNDYSDEPVISADGRYVALTSFASNLVPDDTNGANDVFVHDRVTGVTTRASVSSSREQANGGTDEGYGARPALSADGRYVAFTSAATNLVSGDTNGMNDVFVHDRVTGATTRVSVSSSGEQANGQVPCCWPGSPSMSADGRFVAFTSQASNLVSGDTNGRATILLSQEEILFPTSDVFVRDRDTGTTVRISVASSGEEGNGPSSSAAISADGLHVAFTSWASNLVPGDTNGVIVEGRGTLPGSDIFVHQRAGAGSGRQLR